MVKSECIFSCQLKYQNKHLAKSTAYGRIHSLISSKESHVFAIIAFINRKLTYNVRPQLPQNIEHCVAVHLGAVPATVILETSPHQLMFQANAFVRAIWLLIQTSPASDFGLPITENGYVSISTVQQMKFLTIFMNNFLRWIGFKNYRILYYCYYIWDTY